MGQVNEISDRIFPLSLSSFFRPEVDFTFIDSSERDLSLARNLIP